MVVLMSETKPLPTVWEDMDISKPLASGSMPFTEKLRRSFRKDLVRPTIAMDMPVVRPWRVTWLPIMMAFAERRMSQGRVCWPPTMRL